MIKTQLRLPEEVQAWVKGEAERNERSQNAQIVWALRQLMAGQAVDQREPAGAQSPNHSPAGRINTGRTG
jgi:hypothetical protein